MSEKRLLFRIAAKKIGVAILTEHRLCFHKKSDYDNSSKCDIEYTGNAEDIVYGVVYDIDESLKPILDEIEGLGYGYDIKTVSLKINDKTLDAFTYYATNIDHFLKPYKWYKQHVLTGAIENEMPEYYIQKIKDFEAVSDTDLERRTRELLIYN